MKKLISYIKEYWYVLGAILIAGIVILSWQKVGIFKTPTSIELPYSYYNHEIDINLIEYKKLPDPSPIFEIKTYSKSDLDNFVKLLDISNDSNQVDSFYIYGDEENSITYYPDSGLMYVDFDTPYDFGLNPIQEISEDNINDVTKNIHDLLFPRFPKFNVVSSSVDDEVVIKIDYKIEGYSAGLSSYYLAGSAIEIGLTKYGKLRYLDALMVDEINFVQNMPMMNDEDLEEKIYYLSFPKEIIFEIDTQEASEIHPSLSRLAFLKELRSTEVINSWVYTNSDYKYAVPMYICFGQGVARIEIIDEEYPASTIMYFTSIDPKYLTVRVVNEEDSAEEDPVGRGEGDLFVGEPL